MAKRKTLPGINIQWPWSQLIASGEKTVETRGYPIPVKYIGQELALIETPGPHGKLSAGIEGAKIIGIIVFSGYFLYSNKTAWLNDRGRHCIKPDDPRYSFSNHANRYGWEVASFQPLPKAISPPLRRGIIFAAACDIPVMSRVLRRRTIL